MAKSADNNPSMEGPIKPPPPVPGGGPADAEGSDQATAPAGGETQIRPPPPVPKTGQDATPQASGGEVPLDPPSGEKPLSGPTPQSSARTIRSAPPPVPASSSPEAKALTPSPQTPAEPAAPQAAGGTESQSQRPALTPPVAPPPPMPPVSAPPPSSPPVSAAAGKPVVVSSVEKPKSAERGGSSWVPDHRTGRVGKAMATVLEGDTPAETERSQPSTTVRKLKRRKSGSLLVGILLGSFFLVLLLTVLLAIALNR